MIAKSLAKLKCDLIVMDKAEGNSLDSTGKGTLAGETPHRTYNRTSEESMALNSSK